MRDPYKILGVPRTASDADIKAAYRTLVKKYHPDLNPDSQDMDKRFKEVGAAYAIIGDPDKRARFDKGEIDAEGKERPDFAFQRAWSGGANRTANPFRGREAHPGFGGRSSGGHSSGGGGFDAHDIFDDLFGRGGGGVRGADVTYEMTVDFLDAAKGGRRDLVLSDGKIVSLSIPAGAVDGQTLRLRGQGMAGMRGGNAGDAMVKLSVRPHPYFERKDADIHLTVPVTLKEAVLGGSIEVPTIDGKVSVKVPPNSSSGTLLRLRGKGVPSKGVPGKGVPGKGGERGAQIVHLEIALPEKADDALRRFAEGWNPPDHNPRAKRGF